MARVKVSDLEEIEEREHPIILHPYANNSMYADEMTVLHIVGKHGHRAESDMGVQSKRTYGITNCGRVEDYWEGGNDWSKFNWASDWKEGDTDGYKFCKRCGTPEDFEAIIIQHDKSQVEWKEKYKQEQEEERVLMEQRWSRTKSVILEVEGHLQEAGFHTSYENGKAHISISYWKDGMEYLVDVSVEEIEE